MNDITTKGWLGQGAAKNLCTKDKTLGK
jgi:hypothetical protein